MKYILLLSFIILLSPIYSLDWVRGATQIDQIDPGIRFLKFGGLNTQILKESLPLEFSELSKFSSDYDEKMFFRLSTGVAGKWKGPGSFSIEAFDHNWMPDDTTGDTFFEQTRSIIYLNKGFLFIDSQGMNDGSSIRIETFMGALISRGGIFSIELVKFKNKAQRNAIVRCYQGSLVYQDQVGDTYNLVEGNKISIMLKDDLIKVITQELDVIEQGAQNSFNKERADFAEANAFPKIHQPTKADLKNIEFSVDKRISVQEYYYFPVIEQIKSFNPYNKSNSDD